MKRFVFGLVIILILLAGVSASMYDKYYQAKIQIQDDIVKQWKSGELTKEEAVKEIKFWREIVAEEYCSKTGCKIARIINGS